MTNPETGRIDGGIHRYPVRVYYEDTDAGGIVYHANYLRFAERARTEMLRCLGAPHGDMTASHGVMIVVSSLDIDFLTPARLDDALEVRTKITRVGGASIKMTQLIGALGDDGDVKARIALRLACIDGDGRPVRLPDDAVARTGMAMGRDS